MDDTVFEVYEDVAGNGEGAAVLVMVVRGKTEVTDGVGVWVEGLGLGVVAGVG